MTTPPGLLPEGLRDRLPGEAGRRAATADAMLAAILAHGYDRVDPPLAEFEDGLAERLGSARRDLPRFVDPVSQRTLAIRSDITPQVARIVTSQLAHAARPLRLAYAGQVLKLRATQLSPARQATQIGAELIGSDSVDAAAEIVRVAVAALAAAGTENVTVDLTLPDLVETLCSATLAPDRRARLKALLDMKDAGGIAAEGFAHWLPLLRAMGPIDKALPALQAFDHAGLLTTRIAGIAAIASAIGSTARVTLDPTERHGFEYQSWFGFSLFVPGHSDVIGRGGSYTIAHAEGRAEPATGFSVYPDGLVDLP